MLKSTHRPATAPAVPPLPPPWSEHKAPSGHTYYYNSETKKSTYTRPVSDQSPTSLLTESQQPQPIHYNAGTFRSGFPANASSAVTQPLPFSGVDSFNRRGPYDRQRHSRYPEDRPKSKHTIPDCQPWLLIKTRLGRRFVHNPETKESFWKVPQHLIGGLVEFDIQERERREQPHKEQTEPAITQDRTEDLPQESERVSDRRDGNSAHPQPLVQRDDEDAKSASDEYEEVEVTDDELDETEKSPKRQKIDGEEQGNAQSAEFGEEDMAYQLAQMGASYDLDPGEYGEEDYEGDWEEGAEGLPLSADEASASFKDILDDYNVNPYSMWDNVLEDNRIIEDYRYTILPNMKARKEAFAEWSTAKIQILKQQKEQQIKQNPRIPYLSFLQKHATPKLYWPEFKRKFKREPELKDSGLSDKDREKLYREHITRITKFSEATLTSELKDLLRSIPPSQHWNRSTSLDDALPPTLLTDVKSISLESKVKERVLKDFIATLPLPEAVPSGERSQDELQRIKERERRELALKQRDRQVEEAKRQQQKQLLYGQRRLREEEAELDRAMKVGKGALLESLTENTQNVA